MTEPEAAPAQETTAPADADDAVEAPASTTGVAAADEAAARLADIDDAPVDAHVGIYEDVHRRLQEGLADLDEQ